jgi:hypothetical protein
MMVVKITSRHPVREAFAGCSSGPVYYYTKGHAVNAFDAALKAHGYRFDYADTQCLYGDEGRRECDILVDRDGCYGAGEVVGRALLMWYRMPSGRYEFVGYIA